MFRINEERVSKIDEKRKDSRANRVIEIITEKTLNPPSVTTLGVFS